MIFIVLLSILVISIGVFSIFIIRSILKPKKIAAVAGMLKQGKNAAAVRAAKQLLAKDPRDCEAHYLLGKAYQAEQKNELALMEYRAINQIGQFTGFCQEIPFRKSIAELFLKFNQQEEALKEYLLLIKLEPHEADFYFQAGRLFEERNRSEKARLFYRKAVEVNGNHAGAHFRLGLLLYRAKRALEAKAEIETALKFQPENYEAFFYLGRLLKESHDYVGALLAFEKSQKDPELKAKSLVERGGCYMSMNNYDRAVAELERALKLSTNEGSPETLYGRYFLAVCYERVRKIDHAIEQWEKIYARKPTFKDVAEKLSQYQEFRTDDRVKDFLTTPRDTFHQICSSLTVAMGLSVRDVEEIPNGCRIIAVESESKWRNIRKMPKLIWFLRITDLIDESTVRNMHEEMKNLSVTRGVIVTSSSFSRTALEFVESRPIDLYGKDQLQELLRGIDLHGGIRNR